jgi:hypothetical protein
MAIVFPTTGKTTLHKASWRIPARSVNPFLGMGFIARRGIANFARAKEHFVLVFEG